MAHPETRDRGRAAAVGLAAIVVVVGISAALSALAGAATTGAVVGVSAAAVAVLSQDIAKAVEAAGNALQDCLDAALSRRKACRAAIATPFPPQRDAEQGLCELTYLANVLACGG